MSPRDPNAGAVPIAKLAELESGQRYIRDQVDRDRRAQAERNLSLEDKISRIDETTRQHGKQLAAIGGSVTTIKWLAGIAVALIPTAVGAAWALGRLIH